MNSDINEFDNLKPKKSHNKKNHYVVDRHANLNRKAKKAYKHRLVDQDIEDEDNWQNQIKNELSH